MKITAPLKMAKKHGDLAIVSSFYGFCEYSRRIIDYILKEVVTFENGE